MTMSTEAYQRELSRVEKQFVANSLNKNDEFKLITNHFVEQEIIQKEHLHFEVKSSRQIQTDVMSGTVTEVALSDNIYLWYSNFLHVDKSDVIEQVVGIVLYNDKEMQYEVEDGNVNLVIKRALIETTEDDNSIVPQDNCFVYGNWCGPGCSGPSAPVDDVDRCCMVHDKCYDREGYFDCQCDIDVIECLRGMSGFAAFTVRAYFIAAQVAGFCT